MQLQMQFELSVVVNNKASRASRKFGRLAAWEACPNEAIVFCSILSGNPVELAHKPCVQRAYTAGQGTSTTD